MRYFNTSGICFPDTHYKAARERTLDKVLEQIDRGIYLILSRPRRYGKTTFLSELYHRASDTYEIVWLTLGILAKQALGSEEEFTHAFCTSVLNFAGRKLNLPEETRMQMQQVMQWKTEIDLQDLMLCLRDWCNRSPKPVVLILDEVDCAQDSAVFHDFLQKLREAYQERKLQRCATFQSVILTGVFDPEYLKSGPRPDGQSAGTITPYNIACTADEIDYPLGLSTEGIAQMLTEYASDYHTGMDIPSVAAAITRWTNGYPYLVSRICQILDTEADAHGQTRCGVWTVGGVDEAALRITKENSMFFALMMQKMQAYPSLTQDLLDLMYQGWCMDYQPDNDAQKAMLLSGLMRQVDAHLEIANEIFKVRLRDDVSFRDARAEIDYRAEDLARGTI